MFIIYNAVTIAVPSDRNCAALAHPGREGALEALLSRGRMQAPPRARTDSGRGTRWCVPGPAPGRPSRRRPAHPASPARGAPGPAHGPAPGPPPAFRARPPLRPAAGGGCCSAAAAAAPLAAALGRASAGRSVRAAMELEVPDEAESAEAGAVTAEAAWAAESGAAAGNGPGPRVSPLPEWTRRASSPAGPSGAVRAPEGRRDPLRGGRSLPLAGAPRGRAGWGRPSPGRAARGPREDGTPRREGCGGAARAGGPWGRGRAGLGRGRVQAPILGARGWSSPLLEACGEDRSSTLRG